MDDETHETHKKEVDEAFLITADYLIALVASVDDELYFLANDPRAGQSIVFVVKSVTYSALD